MSSEKSAGLLVYRRRGGALDFLLAHPGGPFWRKKDEGAWSIPKGLVAEGEESLAAALREFQEETGLTVAGDFAELAPARQKSGKQVLSWMVEADLDLAGFRSNDFELAWPKGAPVRRFPEIDRIAYLPADEALRKVLPGQRPILIEAVRRLREGSGPPGDHAP